jgi:membrane-associated protein
MDSLVAMVHEALHRVYNVEGLIEWGGLAVILSVVFAETGLMVGFFLPGDSLLVTAGLFAALGKLGLPALLAGASVAAVAGDAVGYWIGYRVGEPLYRRKESWWFRRDHLLRARAFYEKHGGKTIVLARFMPIIRTFAPVVAGVAQMRYRTFVSFNIWGGIGWVFSMTLLGYFLGRAFPGVLRHIDAVIIVVIFVSILPGIIEVVRSRRSAR